MKNEEIKSLTREELEKWRGDVESLKHRNQRFAQMLVEDFDKLIEAADTYFSCAERTWETQDYERIKTERNQLGTENARLQRQLNPRNDPDMVWDDELGWLHTAVLSTVQADRAQNAELTKQVADYHELLFAVARKYPDETRHQTALRYIRQREEALPEPSAENRATEP